MVQRQVCPSHVCLIHGEESARTQHAAAFIRAAVQQDARALYLCDGPDATEVLAALDDSLLSTGRLVVRPGQDAYLTGGRFDPDAVVGWLRREAALARADGYSGLHVTGQMTWATRGVPGGDRLVEYERRVNAELAGLGVAVMCQYDRRRFQPALLEQAAASHLSTLRILPMLTIERSPAGTLVLAGELDLSNADQLRAALMELVGRRSKLVVDVSRLEFIDLAGVRALVEADEALGGRLELRSPSGQARRVLEVTGALGLRRPGARAAPARRTTVRRAARRGEEAQLFRRLRGDGDPAAREALVERFLPLARQLARRYHRGAEPLEDLVQVASLGLLKAIDRFDPERAVAFSSFAVPTIAGELKRHFRDRGWALRVPRDLQELAARVEQATEKLTFEHGRAPTPNEIAERLGTTSERVLEARQAATAHWTVSLDAPAEDGDEHVGETVGAEDPGYVRAEHAATLARLMDVLSERDREVLRLRFAEDLTQSEIAARVGLSQMHVSRLIRRSVARLREAAG